MNELIQLSETAGARSVELVDDLIDFASQANQAALLHRDLSCDLAFPELRAIAAFKPFLSSVNLVKEYLFTRTGLTASVLPGWDNLSSRCTP